jgi:DUF4097 and DUF4098 domain-containing protein YvlB
MTIILSALMLAAALQQQTDTTVPVPRGARLELEVQAGSIRVATWDRSEMRVRAEHGSRDHIEVEVGGTIVTIKASRHYGVPTSVDYDLTVPRDMALELGGVETEITVEGPVGDVEANSVEGDVIIEGGVGAVRVSGVDGNIQVTGARGEVTVETVDGDVTLEDIDGTSADAGTVDGTITYRGAIHDGGRYRFTSHDGDVLLEVPAGINATVSVSTFEGSFEADPAFKVQITQARPGKRFSFVLGTGSARVELESFDGAIRLSRQ